VLRQPHVKTDSGRSRVWVRLALNAGVLGASIGSFANVDQLYDQLSLWRSTEMRAIALSLMQSLKGLKFDLIVDSPLFDSEPEPSRRPHLLGVAHATKQGNEIMFSKKASKVMCFFLCKI